MSTKEWYQKNRKQVIKRAIKWNKKHPKEHAKACRKWEAENKEKASSYRRKARRKSYGFLNPTGEQKYGKCEICNVIGNLSYDHDHKTGQSRGWLCKKCNTGLGLLQDSVQILQMALRYLKRYKDN